MIERRDRAGSTNAGEKGFFLTRRMMLLAAGAAAADAILPIAGFAGNRNLQSPDESMPHAGGKTRADYPVSPRMKELSAYMAAARAQPLPEEVVEKAKWRLLDTFAASVSGSQLPGGLAARAFANAYGGMPVATVIGSHFLVGAVEAALANSVMGHADETDDVSAGPWHPGTNVLPAALALGEQFRVSGIHLLRALALGYDVGSRVISASGVELDYKHPTNSAGGVFGAAAAAGCIAGFDEQKMRWALSYAAQQYSGIDNFFRDPQHIEKGFISSGIGARAGVTAALLVASGFSGVNDIFSGPVSFFEAYFDAAKPELLVADLGTQYAITHSKLKRWPAGGPTEDVVDAMEALLKRQSIDPGQVREIVIRQQPDFVTDNGGPADINVQHIVAISLIDRKYNFRNAHDLARYADPEVLRLRSMARLIPGPSPLSKGPAPDALRRVPVIQIALADGSRISQSEVAGARGSSSNPYTRDWVVQKARELMTPVLGQANTQRLIDTVLNIESVKDVVEFRPFLSVQRQEGPPRLSEWPVNGSN